MKTEFSKKDVKINSYGYARIDKKVYYSNPSVINHIKRMMDYFNKQKQP